LKRLSSAGFSLVEMALVLLLIGALFGAILKGQAVIHQGKIKKITLMVADLRTAANLFYREQGRLPGDGQGGGVVDGWIKAAQGTEKAKFFEDLVTQRLIPGNPVDVDRRHPMGGKLWVEYFDFTSPADDKLKENFIVIDSLSAEDMDTLDLFLDGDDGNIASYRLERGRVRQAGTYLYVAL